MCVIFFMLPDDLFDTDRGYSIVFRAKWTASFVVLLEI